MQLAVAGAELLLLKEEGVVHEGQGVEDVEAVALSEDERVVDEPVQACLEDRFVDAFADARLRGVVVQVGDPEDLVAGRLDDGRFDVEEGEEVGDFLVFILWPTSQCSVLRRFEGQLTSTTYDHTTCSPPDSILGTNQ